MSAKNTFKNSLDGGRARRYLPGFRDIPHGLGVVVAVEVVVQAGLGVEARTMRFVPRRILQQNGFSASYRVSRYRDAERGGAMAQWIVLTITCVCINN